MSKLTSGVYEKYGASYKTLTLTDGEYALTVTPEKGGMATSFTKNGDEYLWLRDKNFESTDRPRAVFLFCSPTAASPMTAYTTLAVPPTRLRFTALPIWCRGRSRARMIPPLS